MKLRVEYLFVACLLMAVACNQEEYVRDYPQITSSTLKSVTQAGVTAEASIDDAFKDKVTDVGFVWGETDQLSTETSLVVHLGKPGSDFFSTDIRSQLINGKTYYMRAFAKTDKTVVYGLPMTFKSLGSEGAVIHSVSPTLVVPGTVVTIVGERFSIDTAAVRAYIQIAPGFTDLMKIQSLSATEIIAVAPKTVFDTARIAVSIKGDDKMAVSGIVNGKVPKATGVASTDVCSPIQVTGVNFLLLGTPSRIVVNDKVVSPMPTVTETSFTLPASFHSPTLKIEVDWSDPYWGFTKVFDDPAPKLTVTDIPATVNLDNTFVVKGTNFPTCGLLIASTDPNVLLIMSNLTSTQFTVTVFGDLCTPFKLKLEYPFDVDLYTSPLISPAQPFTVTSVSPLSGKNGDQIIIKGTGLDNAVVRLSSTNDQILQYTGTSTQLSATVLIPELYDSTFPIDPILYIEKCNASLTYTYHPVLPTITITNVTPNPVTNAQDIVITGTNFLSDPFIDAWFSDGSYPALMQIKSRTNTAITLSPIQNTWYHIGNVDVSIFSYGRTITFPTQLQITP